MMLARIRLLLCSLAFVTWIAWLGYAVTQRGSVPVLSRAQLLAASDLVVANVSTEAGDIPKKDVQILHTLRGSLPAGTTITVVNLPGARIPAEIHTGFHNFPAGEYFLPLERLGDHLYRVAGYPRSPGLEPANPERPTVYPWTTMIQSQLQAITELP
ncbi:MAG: hypothetical protein LC104_11720 [Bacteroidales bacterium]|nr:hypothetical protein [Bacteroidales bacterium]